MRVTAADLLMGGWHKGNCISFDVMGWKAKTIWAFNTNPTAEGGLSFHDAVKLYKQGVRG